jgi:SAM-dependent methyltransferase
VKSYSSRSYGLRERLEEAWNLYRTHTVGVERRVAGVIEEMQTVAGEVRARSGLELDGIRVLDVGPGQRQGHTLWLAVRNRVVGIDLDVSPQRWQVGAYLNLLRTNDFTRLYKTLGRKLLGIDRRFRAEMRRQLGVARLPRLDIRRMDATRMTFPDACFDFVFSRSVFEHIAQPEAAVEEVARVLAPGGCAHIIVHLYTSDSGCHDVRILAGRRGDLPLWSHLRARYSHKVRPNSFLNQLRLAEWQAIFDRHMPGARHLRTPDANPTLHESLDALRRAGELADYTDEELLTVALNVTWTKERGGLAA